LQDAHETVRFRENRVTEKPIQNLKVVPERIGALVDQLAQLTEPDRPYTRRSFTPMFLRGRAFLKAAFEQAGLQTRIDAGANLLGRLPGRQPSLGTILLGSHSDTVPDGGRFDGIAGIATALEVARTIQDLGIRLNHDLEIVDFLAEEVSVFGLSCIGSRSMAGVLPQDWLYREANGANLRAGIIECGGDPDRLMRETARTDIRAFLELHIEQGRVLELAREDIGLVSAISGITRIEIIVEGQADHAGTTIMGHRKDALAAAARIVTAVEALATTLSKGPTHFAATVGEFSIEPNAANVVPSKARMLIDARAENRQDMQNFREALKHRVAAIAQETGVSIAEPHLVSDNPPTPGDPFLLDTLEEACTSLGLRHRRMASGAGHDTAWMARITRSAMIFIPCREGRSHVADEWADLPDLSLGAAVLLEAVLRLDQSLKDI
jgi:beta-ureidopropionase / N-carbamoyl-L-amino-acid hydrolase